jgi:hypothetical protein
MTDLDDLTDYLNIRGCSIIRTLPDLRPVRGSNAIQSRRWRSFDQYPITRRNQRSEWLPRHTGRLDNPCSPLIYFALDYVETTATGESTIDYELNLKTLTRCRTTDPKDSDLSNSRI